MAIPIPDDLSLYHFDSVYMDDETGMLYGCKALILGDSVTTLRMPLAPPHLHFWEGPTDDPRYGPWVTLPYDPFGGNYGPPPGPPGGGC